MLEQGESLDRLTSAAKASPNDHALLNRLGVALYSAKRLQEAASCLRQAVALSPISPTYHLSLGTVLRDLGDGHGAEASFRRSLSLNPKCFFSLMSLGDLLQKTGRREMSRSYFQRAVEVDPNSVEARLRWSDALRELGEVDEAEVQARRAVELEPENYRPHEALGHVFRLNGRFEDAISSYGRAISICPQLATNSFYGIVQSKKLTESDRPFVDRMSRWLHEEESLPHHKRLIQLSLAKAFDDLGEYGAAMALFNAVRLEAAGLEAARFDREETANTVKMSKQFFPAGVFNRYSHGLESDLPVLIVGMPRSGTTLMEQIVSSHSQVKAGGEIHYWRESALSSRAISVFDPSSARTIASGYRRLLRGLGPNSRRVTDKMPLNYVYLGPIHLMFPNARIIHCRRHPVDTCLSILMNTMQLPKPPNYIFNLEDMVYFYRKYLELMEHWRHVLPPDRFLEIDYEVVVSDRENVTRKIIEFIGLEWEDACLRYENNARSVDTPSKWQVRQPIYSTSVERWRRYERWLGPLADLLPAEEMEIKKWLPD